MRKLGWNPMTRKGVRRSYMVTLLEIGLWTALYGLGVISGWVAVGLALASTALALMREINWRLQRGADDN